MDDGVQIHNYSNISLLHQTLDLGQILQTKIAAYLMLVLIIQSDCLNWV